MHLPESSDPAITEAVAAVIAALRDPEAVEELEIANKRLAELVMNRHLRAKGVVMSCPCCLDTGYIMVEYPAYGSDVVQARERCNCNPAATDDELPDWQDVPELWGQDYPGIDYDAPLRDSHYHGI